MKSFDIIGEIEDIETIASGRSVFIRRYLERAYGKGRWRKMKGVAAGSTFRWYNLHSRDPLVRSTRHRPQGFQNQTDAAMSDFVICINNDGNPASLIVGKVYRTLSDSEAQVHQMLRVVDEDQSEPDGYLYPASMFAPIEVPEAAKRVLMAAGD